MDRVYGGRKVEVVVGDGSIRHSERRQDRVARGFTVEPAARER